MISLVTRMVYTTQDEGHNSYYTYMYMCMLVYTQSQLCKLHTYKMHRCTRWDNIRKTERKEVGKGGGTKADKRD